MFPIEDNRNVKWENNNGWYLREVRMRDLKITVVIICTTALTLQKIKHLAHRVYLCVSRKKAIPVTGCGGP
jgi:hypothetical protein